MTPPDNASLKTLLLLGATGLVGQQVLQKALADLRISRVVAPTRRPLPAHARLLNPVLDFAQLPADAPWWAADAVVCALGSTMAKAGTEEAFRQVDLALPLQAARLAKAMGAQTFALNSALGADAHSRVFYPRTKGELEDALRDLNFCSLTLVRPSLIAGQRQESRPAEQIGVWLTGALAPLLPHRWRVVPAERIAHHLLESALTAAPGVTVLESEALV